MRIFLHFEEIPNFEAFTFVNRRSALHSCVLHEYFKLLLSAILYSVYCIYACVVSVEMILAIQKVEK